MKRDQKILIVDDRPENLMALDSILVALEAQTVAAADGNAALTACLNHEFALALLDVQMPGMDGYELAELLRGDARTDRIPIIFLTAAYGESQHVFRGYEAGAVDYIVKPYEPAVLLGKVRVFLELDAQRRELQAQRVQLEAVNRELEAFSYSVSHDLRAPLRAIEGFSQALLEDLGDQLDGPSRVLLDRLSFEARRMAQLIQDLLTLSRVTRAEMRIEPVDLTALARDVAAMLRQGHPQSTAEIDVQPGLKATGDPRLLRQLLENLIGNAWKFSSDRPQPMISVGATNKDGRTEYFVRDNGAGFDMRYADKLFVPFQRLHGAEEFAGTGVGLSTVLRIVTRHGGRIWAEGEVGRGATFTFTLGERLAPPGEPDR